MLAENPAYRQVELLDPPRVPAPRFRTSVSGTPPSVTRTLGESSRLGTVTAYWCYACYVPGRAIGDAGDLVKLRLRLVQARGRLTCGECVLHARVPAGTEELRGYSRPWAQASSVRDHQPFSRFVPRKYLAV
jgi:hypothetical protein